MGIRVRLFVFCSVIYLNANAALPVLFSAPSPSPIPQNIWSRVAYPTRDANSNPIGFYSNGCIAGAKALPLDGEGYQAMRTSRNRQYGTAELIQYIEQLAISVKALGSGLLIGDMGQPRGGPMPYGHASHQMGLDVDIWFWTHPEQNTRSLTFDEREKLPMLTVLNANGLVDPTKFTKEHYMKLKLASASDQVQRIFVNPAIKVYLCSSLDEKDRGWLHKLRPWPGHDEHFHVRLYCPKDAKDCETQDPVPDGDGCAEVMPPRGNLHFEDSGGNGFEIEKESGNEALLEKLFQPAGLPAACDRVIKQ